MVTLEARDTAGRARVVWMVAATSLAATLVFTVPAAVLAPVPRIAAALRATQSDVEWISVAYPLLVASLLLPAGVLADRWGRRRALVLGLGLMASGLFWASSAASPLALAGALAAAGLGAGIAFPCTLATITLAVPEAYRSAAVGVWATAVPLGGLFGTMLSSVVVTLTSKWEPTFVIAGALVCVTIALTVLTVPETRRDEVPRLDLPGALLSMVGVATLVLGMTQAPVHGWAATTTVSYLTGSAVALIAFVIWELRCSAPLIDVRVFLLRGFSATAAALLGTFFALYLLTSVGFQYEAYALGFTPLKVAFGMAPMVLLMLPFALIGPTVANRLGPKPVIAIALALGAAASVTCAASGAHSGYLQFAAGVLIFGGCVGLCAGPTTEIITQELPPAKQGIASGVNNLTREIGATLGIAIGGTAFNIGYRHAIAAHLHLDHRLVTIAKDSPIAGLQVAAHLGARAPHYLEAVHYGVNRGWVLATSTSAAALILALALFLKRFPGTRTARAKAQPPTRRSRLGADGPSGRPTPAPPPLAFEPRPPSEEAKAADAAAYKAAAAAHRAAAATRGAAVAAHRAAAATRGAAVAAHKAAAATDVAAAAQKAAKGRHDEAPASPPEPRPLIPPHAWPHLGLALSLTAAAHLVRALARLNRH
jgi:MFS family permease